MLISAYVKKSNDGPWGRGPGRCVGDLEGLDLGPEVLDAYAYGNAQRVFFGA